MTIKDWVLLIVPSIISGLVLWMVQRRSTVEDTWKTKMETAIVKVGDTLADHETRLTVVEKTQDSLAETVKEIQKTVLRTLSVVEQVRGAIIGKQAFSDRRNDTDDR